MGFFADGQLKRVAVAGGNPVVVCEASAGRGGLWLDDDTIVFAPTATSPLLRVNAAGGSPAPFTALTEAETSHRFPQRLPGRQLLYFSVNRTPEKSGTRLVTIDDPRQPITFIPTRGAAEYVNGFLVFVPCATGGPAPRARAANDASRRPAERRADRDWSNPHLGNSGTLRDRHSSRGRRRHARARRRHRTVHLDQSDGRVLDTVGTPTSQFGVELSPDGQ